MPTTRPRYLLTESDAMRVSLDLAARRWPDDRDRPTALLLHLIDEGARTVEAAEEERRRARRAAIRRGGQGLEGVYAPKYLEELRTDWPE